MDTCDVIILGSGPAGGTAAIYAARAGLTTALISGPMPGGQLTTTHRVENFPGFPEGVEGPKFGQLLEEQAKRFGAEFLFDVITTVDLGERPFALKSESKAYRGRTLIIATGSTPRRLGIPAEKEFANRGVSTCATCDGHFFRDKIVGVVGGGDSAAEEAVYLSRLASHVHLIHRRDALRAGPVLAQRVLESDKITVEWNSVVTDIQGDDSGVQRVMVEDTQTHDTRAIAMQGLFVSIGHVPNTSLFGDALQLGDEGTIMVDRQAQTNVPGVFAAGDVADPYFRQAITAAGTGASAAISAVRFLEAND
jgi:thioredoxin reductase (NADPH)